MQHMHARVSNCMVRMFCLLSLDSQSSEGTGIRAFITTFRERCFFLVARSCFLYVFPFFFLFLFFFLCWTVGCMSFLHFCVPIPCLCCLDCRFSCLLLALLDFPTSSFCPGCFFPRFHWAARRCACFNASMAMIAPSFISISMPSVSWVINRSFEWH